MSSEINSLIANYMQSHSTADMSDIIDSMKNIQDSLYENGCIGSDSVFNFGDDGVASKEEFLELMANATGKDSSEIEDDVNLLFDILNSESDDDILTSDELGYFGSSFDSWNHLSTVDENKINEKYSAASSSDDDLQTTGTSSDEDTSTSGVDDDTDVDDGTDASDDTSDDDTTTTTTTTSTDTSTVEGMKAYIEELVTRSNSDEYECPEDVIKVLEDSGNYSADFIEDLRNAFVTYSDEDETAISVELDVLQLTNPDATREDAIQSLEDKGAIGDPQTTAETSLSSGTLTDAAAKYNAEKLDKALNSLGTDEDALDEVFNDETLTSADYVSIMLQYSELNDGEGNALVTDIDQDFKDGSDRQTKYYTKMVDSLLEEIEAGNEDAVTVLCQQIYGATAGQTGTANEFLEILFDNISDEALYKVYEAYGDVNDGHSLTEDIEKDYQNGGVLGFIFGTDKTGSSYITKIDEAINEYGRE